MVHEIRYETPVSEWHFFPRPWVFLAGPTVRGHQQHLQPSWRFAAIEEFKRLGFEGTLIIPEFTDTSESDKGRKDIPLWEYEGLRCSDCIMFWIPRTRELIGLTTNFELGYWMREEKYKVLYGRPDDAYRIDYLDILWKKDFEVHEEGESRIFNSLSDLVKDTMALCDYWAR